ncbi:hypothetical protein OG890_38910 [Streptomyces anulatus]|uniref:hypothetical protein n=1 Tax=Streptomyces anulatus TaxID=1892 RepID=UPI002256D666|nr:hypothetical protein [Streptomyces anulatus]MCX4489817.1 hypothetical protein [Streptomyces anulatus]MCX4489860.1 hypothetical protein [Streptomyces anulatus]
MPPRPSNDRKEQLKREVEEVLAQRDERLKKINEAKEDAERDFWQRINVLRQAYFGAQTDVAAATGYTRDHILKQVTRYSERPPNGETSDQR